MNPIFIILLGLILLALGIVIVLQNRKIKELQRPKYGFLGKTLSIAGILLMVGTLSILIIPLFTNDNLNTVDVSSKEIFLQIEYSPINLQENYYQFKVIPVVDNVAWGNNANINFDIVWQVESVTGQQTFVEDNLNLNSQGGINVTLEKGENVITAKYTVGGREIKESMTLNIK